ncbi:MAG: LamB/YcsF family protein, partial [Solirubrobacteraceae bacterium]
LDLPLALLGPPGSELLGAAGARGPAPAAEGFSDRAPPSHGRLLPRSEPGGVLDEAAALAQAEQIAVNRRATATDGAVIAMAVESLCLHSDTPGAADLARALRARLERAGIKIRSFAA